MTDVALDHHLKNITTFRDELRVFGDYLAGEPADMSFLDDEDTDVPYVEPGDFILPPFVQSGNEFMMNFEVNTRHMLRIKLELLVKEQIEDLAYGELEATLYGTFVTTVAEKFFPYALQMVEALIGQNQDLWRLGWKAIQ